MLQPPNEVVAKFQEWMRSNYGSCKEQLLKLLGHESHDVQVSCLVSGLCSIDCSVFFTSLEGCIGRSSLSR